MTKIPPKPKTILHNYPLKLKNFRNGPKTYKMTERHGFKNYTEGKIGFAPSSWFLLVFDRFWAFLPDQTGTRFSVKPASLVRFLKLLRATTLNAICCATN